MDYNQGRPYEHRRVYQHSDQNLPDHEGVRSRGLLQPNARSGRGYYQQGDDSMRPHDSMLPSQYGSEIESPSYNEEVEYSSAYSYKVTEQYDTKYTTVPNPSDDPDQSQLPTEQYYEDEPSTEAQNPSVRRSSPSQESRERSPIPLPANFAAAGAYPTAYGENTHKTSTPSSPVPPPSSSATIEPRTYASTAVYGARPGQSDDSAVAVNPIPDSSYQSRPGYRHYEQQQNVYDSQSGAYYNQQQQQHTYDDQSGAYYHQQQNMYNDQGDAYYHQQPNTYDNQDGAYNNYGNRQQHHRYSFGYGGGAYPPELAGTGYHAPTSLKAMGIAPVTPAPPSPRPPGSDATVVPPKLAPAQEKPADVWDFPEGSRPSRTKPAVVVPAGSGNSNAGSTDPLPHAPTGPVDPTGPAYGTFKLEKRCCGCRQKNCLIITFVLCILIATALFFIWPRIPDVTVSDIETKYMSIRTQNNPKGYGFEGEWEIALAFDNGNFLPWAFETTTVTIRDSQMAGDAPIGTSTITGLQPPRGYSNTLARVNVSYVASSVDSAIHGMVDSCSSDAKVPIQITVDMTMSILTFVKGSKQIAGSYKCKTK